MSAVVYEFRPFQSAAIQAKRVGIPTKEAVNLVHREQRNGGDGRIIAYELSTVSRDVPVPPPGGFAA